MSRRRRFKQLEGNTLEDKVDSVRWALRMNDNKEVLQVLEKLSIIDKLQIAVHRHEEDDLPLLAFTVIHQNYEVVRALLGDPKQLHFNINAAAGILSDLTHLRVQKAIEDAGKEALTQGKYQLVKLLLTVDENGYYCREETPRARQIDSEIMCFACNNTEKKQVKVIKFLYDQGFRVHPMAQERFGENKRAAEYYYERFNELKARSCSHYIIQQALDPNRVRTNKSEQPNIKDDNSVFDIALSIFPEIDVARKESNLFLLEYKQLKKDLQRFLIELVQLSKCDDEHMALAKINSNLGVFQDREFIPLLKRCCDMELKELASCKPFQGVIDFVVYRYMRKTFPRWPKGTLGFILLLLTGLTYPLLSIWYLLMPNTFLGEFSHYPSIAFACEAGSEMYFLVYVLIYPYIATTSTAFQTYNIILIIITFTKLHKEGMEIVRRGMRSYYGDFFNFLDQIEIVLLFTVTICRFVNNPYDDVSKYHVANIIADSLFCWAPIFIMVRMLILLRVNRKLGTLQISFTKMFGDVFAWVVIVLTILFGYSITFFLFTQQTLSKAEASNQSGMKECKDTQWHKMYGSDSIGGFWHALQYIFFVMMNQPDTEGLAECFSFRVPAYIFAYVFMASFSLMVIIVLVNLLIAMMSKTHDSVCDDGVQEIEWAFYMINLWVMFVRRDFVAPIPMNILPHFHKHLCGSHAFWRKKKVEPVVTVMNDAYINDVEHATPPAVADPVAPTTTGGSPRSFGGNLVMSFDVDEIVARNKKYEQVAAELVKRYKRKHLVEFS